MVLWYWQFVCFCLVESFFLTFGTFFVSVICDIVCRIKISNIKILTKMKIQPLADRVLISPKAAEEKTAGGIIIPDTAKEKPLEGTVVAVGEGKSDEKMILKKGDKVLYGKYAGTELEYDGEKYLIMRQSDVVAILK